MPLSAPGWQFSPIRTIKRSWFSSSLLQVVVVILAGVLQSSSAFTPQLVASTKTSRVSSSTTVLFYRNDTSGDHHNNEDEYYDPFGDMYARTKIDPSAVLTIPVLGPIPGMGPLLLGAEMTLDPPTPWQWQTIEEAVWQHSKFLNHHDDAHNQGTIDAAPLVAIMESTTSSLMRQRPGMPKGRYATIAAVVGMTTAAGSTNEGKQGLDLTDSSSFSISLRNAGREAVSPWESKIRLMAVGRAVLSDFFYRMPSRHQQDSEDDQGYVTKLGESSKVTIGLRYREEENSGLHHLDDDEEDDDEIFDDSMNLVFAHFVLLTDGVDRTVNFQKRGRNHARGNHNRAASASPVHAIAEMATWARKMDFLHQDRRRLVAGLQAATARLQMAGQLNNAVDDSFYDDFEDYDGLGLLTASRYDTNIREERVASQAAVEDILQIPPAVKGGGNDDFNKNAQDDENASPLAKMENYGMGYSSASFLTLPQVTKKWLDTLEPFYSPEFRATEEYYYEILSFATILSMDKFLDDRDVGWALTCSNTIERMQQTYEWLWRHVRLLEQEASVASAKLRDCGEECTDLW